MAAAVDRNNVGPLAALLAALLGVSDPEATDIPPGQLADMKLAACIYLASLTESVRRLGEKIGG